MNMEINTRISRKMLKMIISRLTMWDEDWETQKSFFKIQQSAQPTLFSMVKN